MNSVRIAGAGVPGLHPVSLTCSVFAVLCFKVALRYILRFATYPDVGDWGDTYVCKITDGMTDFTVEQPEVSRWLGLDLLLFLLTQRLP